MRKEISVILLGCACVCAFAAPKKAAVKKPDAPQNEATLDTVRETFADGALSRIYTLQKGTDIREGLSVSYHPNGKIAIEAPYKNGKLDGVFRSYYENGHLWQTIGYKDGVEEGATTDYYEDGRKKKREIYKAGVLNGMSEEWNERGLLWRQIPYVNGRIHGVAKIFDELGAIKEEMTFENGLRNGPYRRFTKGVKTLEAIFENNRCKENCDF
ncbi:MULTISPECIES: toxin-antitoxin system YwqK family antitoxin [unclassified Fibrobacter]|jgi:antitoxin component YwqK of YwqJK toxin-antitoxin module|uniref:toxin-antitoxin system YwqK family antitoxin n=1 Tax=unclassified Fibrobacter TaxID=2634177 RepID=UPI001564A0F0|nr:MULTISPECIES: toxin-antitoxin system YwqK family antitoxin [unclassified Fibrobacter]